MRISAQFAKYRRVNRFNLKSRLVDSPRITSSCVRICPKSPRALSLMREAISAFCHFGFAARFHCHRTRPRRVCTLSVTRARLAPDRMAKLPLARFKQSLTVVGRNLSKPLLIRVQGGSKLPMGRQVDGRPRLRFSRTSICI